MINRSAQKPRRRRLVLKDRLGLLLLAVVMTLIGCQREGAAKNGEGSPACPALPGAFQPADLVGTWIGVYFGNTDRLVIRDDGRYKQVYQFYRDELPGFESEWNRWYLETDSRGNTELHLLGMRRCDGTDFECNHPGGGLSDDTPVVNPCEQALLYYPAGEVILFVTGSDSDVPRGIMLQPGRLAGSDWSYTYELEK
jgi:hypothetical protein